MATSEEHHNAPPAKATVQFSILLVLMQILFIAFFAGFAEYESSLYITDSITGEVLQDQSVGSYYPFWQDVHVMMYAGFGFLLVYLGRHQFSSVGYTFLIGAVVFQWSLLTNGFFSQPDPHGHTHWHKLGFGVKDLIRADYAVASVLISFSGVLGKLTPTQYLIMAFIEIIFYSFNEWIGVHGFGAIDIGGSMFIHTFGCYFGLTVAMFFKRNTNGHKYNISTYKSDTFAMIGTVFLWMFWPSFNGALAVGAQQHRVIINTSLSLCCSCTGAFLASNWLRGKFEMVDIQNASLAGGVAVGSCSDLIIGPFSACMLGFLSGTVSVLGYVYLTPFLNKKIGLHDSAGINNLHGMPGIIGGLGGILSSLDSPESVYGNSIGTIFPRRAPSNETLAKIYGVVPGEDRSAETQAGFQAACLFVSIGLSIFGGLITGAILRIPWIDQLPGENLFNDNYYWHTPTDDPVVWNSDGHAPAIINHISKKETERVDNKDDDDDEKPKTKPKAKRTPETDESESESYSDSSDDVVLSVRNKSKPTI